MDRRERAKNIIITGAEKDQAHSDMEQVTGIMTQLGLPEVTISSMRSLGKPDSRGKRSLLVSLENKSERDAVLQNTKKLKEGSDEQIRIFIKKDLHPL